MLTSAFSNRPSGSSTFQAIHQLQCRCRSRARASLRTRHQGSSIMGFEDEVEQSFGRPCRQCNGRLKQTYELTSSIVPRGTSFHRWVELDFLLSHLILHSSQAATTSLVHRNSVPSAHMRCMITANRRASATIAGPSRSIAELCELAFAAASASSMGPGSTVGPAGIPLGSTDECQ